MLSEKRKEKLYETTKCSEKLTILAVLVLAVFGTFLMAKPVRAAESGQVTVTGYRSYSYAWQVLSLVNQERTKVGLPALTMDQELLDAAMQRAYETAVYYSHTRPDGRACFTASSLTVGENIAAGQFSPAHVMNSWMNSEGHRANILDTGYASIGIGAVEVDGRYYWVQCFSGATSQEADRGNYTDGNASAAVSFEPECCANPHKSWKQHHKPWQRQHGFPHLFGSLRNNPGDKPDASVPKLQSGGLHRGRRRQSSRRGHRHGNDPSALTNRRQRSVLRKCDRNP